MNSLKTTARWTGVFYLGLGITGMVGFLVLRPQLFDAASAEATLANLAGNPWLAEVGIALELGVVLTQALAAIWFFKLFRPVNSVAAVGVAAFGLVNAVAIMVSAMMMSTALSVALDPALAPAGDAAGAAQLMFIISTEAWAAGNLFFGLWLIPMGYAAYTSGRMPKALGLLLMVGGVGYVLNCFTAALVPGLADSLDLVLALPATAGEFWMIGYLLSFGIRPERRENAGNLQAA